MALSKPCPVPWRRGMAAAGEAASIKRSPATRQMVPCQERNGPLPKKRNGPLPREEWFPAKRGTVPCQKRNGPLPKLERSPAKRGMVPCRKRNGPLPKEDHGPLPKRCAHFRDLEECMRASRLAASSRRRACATCGLLFLHFLLNLVLWVPRPRPTTKRAANSLRSLIIWVGALAHEGATRVEGILNQKSQV